MKSVTRVTVGLLVAGLVGLGLAGCVPGAPTVATFEVAGVQTYKIQLITQEQIEHVKALMARSEQGRIPNGKVVRDVAGVNSP